MDRTARASGGYSRTGEDAAARAAMLVTAHRALIPKLIVRVRFSSPAPPGAPPRSIRDAATEGRVAGVGNACCRSQEPPERSSDRPPGSAQTVDQLAAT